MKDLASAVVQGIPANLDAEKAEYCIGHKTELAGRIRKIIIGMNRTSENRHQGIVNRRRQHEIDFFGQELDLSGFEIQEIVNRECQYHLDFFGRYFDLSEFEKTLKKYGQKKMKEWQKLGLEPHFLPKVVLSQDDNLLGWEIKPKDWYYQIAAGGRIMRDVNGELVVDKEPFKLEGITVLIDTRLKPAYNDGGQMYENDNLLGPIIEELRKNEKIDEYKPGPQSSRFGVSSDEWESQIKPALAKELGLEVVQLRLERVIEANVIPQLYPYMSRKDDGVTDTWVWYEEFFEDRDYRLRGGCSDGGGLTHVAAIGLTMYWSSRSVRSLAVL